MRESSVSAWRGKRGRGGWKFDSRHSRQSLPPPPFVVCFHCRHRPKVNHFCCCFGWDIASPHAATEHESTAGTTQQPVSHPHILFLRISSTSSSSFISILNFVYFFLLYNQNNKKTCKCTFRIFRRLFLVVFWRNLRNPSTILPKWFEFKKKILAFCHSCLPWFYFQCLLVNVCPPPKMLAFACVQSLSYIPNFSSLAQREKDLRKLVHLLESL